jgi:hypothetical protein
MRQRQVWHEACSPWSGDRPDPPRWTEGEALELRTTCPSGERTLQAGSERSPRRAREPDQVTKQGSSGLPPGDVVDARRALEAISQMQWREKLQDRELRLVVEGTNDLLSREAAAVWIDESARLGFTQVRYFVVDDDGRRLVVQLAASSPLELAEATRQTRGGGARIATRSYCNRVSELASPDPVAAPCALQPRRGHRCSESGTNT